MQSVLQDIFESSINNINLLNPDQIRNTGAKITGPTKPLIFWLNETQHRSLREWTSINDVLIKDWSSYSYNEGISQLINEAQEHHFGSTGMEMK